MTIDKLVEYLIVLAATHPGYPASVVVEAGEIMVGLLNFQPDLEDWYTAPESGGVLTAITAPAKILLQVDNVITDDVAQR